MFDETRYLDFINSQNIEFVNNRCACPLCNKIFTKNRIYGHIKTHFGYNIRNVKGHSCSLTARKKISESMILAHREKRAYNIGYRKNRLKASYPEIFFMKVIKNHFNDKYYKYNYQFHQFQLDFAWPHIKKCIEIDGEQHYRTQENIDRDNRKNKKLCDENWICLRIRWKDFYHQPHEFIQMAKDFIDENLSISEIEKRVDDYHAAERHTLRNIIAEHKKYLEINGLISKKIKDKTVYNIDVAHKQALIVNQLIDNIDMTKFGWVNKASKIIGISDNGARRWMKNNCPWLLDKAYCRKSIINK